MGELEPVPSHVAGYTIMGAKALRLGVFGRDYLGHSQEGLRLLKVLRAGEGLVVGEETYAALKEDASLLVFEAGSGGETSVFTHHTVQAAALGVLVGGSPLQNEVIETTREFDEEQRCAATLRSTTLVQKVQLLKQLSDALAGLHKRGVQHPWLTPWNVVLEGDRIRLLEVGLGLKPDDPGFKRESIPEDVLVFLAPEVLRAVREGTIVQASPAADVYALAATARAFLHNRVPDPSPTGAPPDASRHDLALRGAGLELRPHDHYSRELEQLLQRALTADPQRRPSAAELSSGLQRLVEAQQLEWKPVPTWPKYAAIGVAAVAVLVGAFLLLRPDPQRVLAQRSYAEATRTQDPEQRKVILQKATVRGDDGSEQLLPEARRLQAVDAWVAWERAPQTASKEQLEAVLQGLEDQLITGREDELSRTARVVVGLMRRWEQAGPAREKGDALLKGVTGDDDLAALARAALAMTAAGPATPPKEEELKRWSEAAAGAGLEVGPLQHPWPLHAEGDYTRELGVEPVGISLQAGWIAQLVGGVVQTARGMQADASTKLKPARDAVPIFATKAALGLLLAGMATTPENAAEARSLLEEALAVRDFAEARLALGRLQLAAAHQKGSGFREAVAAFQAAAGAAPETPGADIAARAQLLEAEALFYQATAQAAAAFREGAASEADKAALEQLNELLRRCEEDPQRFERFLPDAHVARGLVLSKLKQADKAAEDLLFLFQDKDVTRGWAELPALAPVPPTRQDPAQAVKPLFEALLARVENLAANAKKEDLSGLERVLGQAKALTKLPSAKVLEPADHLRLLLAEVKGALTRAKLLPDGRQADQALAEAEAACKAALELAGQTERWLDALSAKLEVYKAMAQRVSAGARIGEALAPLKKAIDELNAAAQTLPAVLRRQWRDFEPKEMSGLREAYMSRVDAYAKDREADWNAIDLQNPGYSPEQATEEIEVLEQAARLFGEEVPPEQAFKVATLRWRLMQLYRARRLNPKVLEHGELASRLLDVIDPAAEPRVVPLGEKVHYLLGLIAVREGESLKGTLRDPRQYGYDELSRAAGARDFADLRNRMRAGNWQPKQDPARLLAEDVVKAYDDEKVVPRDPKYGQEVRDARRIEAELVFATQMDPKNATAFLTLARVQFSLGQDKLEAAVKSAETSYELAQAAGQDKLATLVQAARLYCYARFQLSSKAATDPEKFRTIAERGAKAAEELFRRDQQATQASYNFGPAYWVARSYYEEGLAAQRNNRVDLARPALDKAKTAFEDFRRQVEGHDVPAEASQWQSQYQNTVRTLESLPKR